MSYINFVQYNLPFTVEQDDAMRELGLTFWGGLNNNVEFPVLENNSILISHLGFWAAEGCKITIQDYEYENGQWRPHTREFQIGAGNKIEFNNVRLYNISVAQEAESNNNEEYWGSNAKLDMCIADFETLEKIENKEITDAVPAYWTEVSTQGGGV